MYNKGREITTKVGVYMTAIGGGGFKPKSETERLAPEYTPRSKKHKIEAKPLKPAEISPAQLSGKLKGKSSPYPSVDNIDAKIKLAQQFKPGDVVFWKFTRPFSVVKMLDWAISLSQKLVNVVRGKKDREFFCTYFAAHAFQQAELSQKLKSIEAIEGVKEGLQEIERTPEGPERTKKIRQWAREMAKDHKDEINKVLETFTLDPKHTSPYELIEFLQKDTFHTVFTITPPK